MKSLMDGIINALKRLTQEKSQLAEKYRVYDSSLIEQEDYYDPEDYNSP